jgi:hypothetical protein
MKRSLNLLAARNARLAKGKWFGELGKQHLEVLRYLTENYGFAVALGDVLLLEGKWYVTHAGLLRLAARSQCQGIRVQQVRDLCDPLTGRWVFKASVYKSSGSKSFIGFGDADPSNVSSVVHGAEMRVAETRAVNRALRKAYGIGLCSVEELGAVSQPTRPSAAPSQLPSNGPHHTNGSGNGQPRLRDQLCLLIRQYNLDANLVKAYAADFCGTETLRGASRELVESFISHLSACAKENLDALVCRLNSYSPSQQAEAKS